MTVIDDIISGTLGGHNILILGQAGTGKSILISKLFGILKGKGKDVRVAATTGLAATRLPTGTTVHHLFGLLDGRFNKQQLVERVLSDDAFVCVKRTVLKTDVVIIDEVSMLSKKVFEDIEWLCRKVRDCGKPFGGIQFILAGDLFQLKPVPNLPYGDGGEHFIRCLNIDVFLPHRFVLTEVHRQNEGIHFFLNFPIILNPT